MNNELATRNGEDAALVFDQGKLDLLKRTICRDATDDELQLFIHACKRTGLDPFMKQIHAVKRWDDKAKRAVMSVQTGIDGYRLIADRSGRYAGNDDPAFTGEAGGGFPAAATVTVYKLVGNIRCPFSATARWSEYYPGDKQGFMWKRMPHVMLGKVAEALALRKAFPAELSGVYTREEMEQAGPAAEAVDAEPDPLDDEDEFKQQLAAAFRAGGWEVADSDAVTAKVLKKHRAASLASLPLDKRREFIGAVTSGKLNDLKGKKEAAAA